MAKANTQQSSQPRTIEVTPPQGEKPATVTSKPAQPQPQPQQSASAQVSSQGQQVELKVMEGVTAENFTTFTKEQLITGYGNKSNAIRGLHALGIKAGPISKQLDIRYQHARNVLLRPLKREIAEQRKSGNAK